MMGTEQHVRPAQAPQVTTASRMQAIVQDKYGEAEDVLRLAEIDRPEIGAGEVLLRVHAAGVDRGVWHLMTGLAYPIRLVGYGPPPPSDKCKTVTLEERSSSTSDGRTTTIRK